MSWQLATAIFYFTVVSLVCIRIIYETRTSAKALAYLLVVVFVPFIGIFFYFSFGINYRKRQLYSKKLIEDDKTWQKIKDDISIHSLETYSEIPEALRPNKHLAQYLSSEMSPLTAGNSATLLLNGEEKFPALIKALEGAKEYIHIEYYIYENDKIGQTIADILIKKAQEGIVVRFIYDDFGSRGIRKNIARRLTAAGVQAFPFYKIAFLRIANRLNYRNHRKIIVIDGREGFVGGINISDRYINDNGYPARHKLFWRDTHLMMKGPGVQYLQYLFLCDWNFCSGKPLENIMQYFPTYTDSLPGNKIIQISASGPDSGNPTILYSLLFAINQAQEEILVTTPYFIPEQSIMDALLVAALGGISVKLLVPEKGDSKLVELAASSYYEDLLDVGGRVFFYQKGFVHAKTIVVDRKLAIIGTANMDFRSFDLNFEVNAIVYDPALATSLADVFHEDLKGAAEINKDTWSKRSATRKFLENSARLVSPLL
jgi:cardiolipin synthase A/B